MIRGFAGLALTVLAGACASARGAHPTLQATLWVQTAAEYRALAEGTYRQATRALAEALADSSWTAAVEQAAAFRGLPPAVIVDVDETVLDNSPFQARVIREGGEFDPALWERWVGEAGAASIPGAVDFASEAARRGVTVFYITNRDSAQETATRVNLAGEGFPLAQEPDVVLTRGEREGWTSDKSSRRTTVARDFRVLLVIGDDLNDFVPASLLRSERAELVRRHDERWGIRWFILPNPVYGSWESALLAGESDLSREERLERQEAALTTE